MVDPVKIDEVDKRLLRLVQEGFSIARSPWRRIAESLGISEDETLKRARRLQGEGVIKKISPVLETRELGLNASTLILMKVPEERLVGVADIISGYDGVSHNYEREHEYNLWFTLTASDDDELRRTLNEIKEKAKISDEETLDLPVIRRFKINVRFQL